MTVSSNVVTMTQAEIDAFCAEQWAIECEAQRKFMDSLKALKAADHKTRCNDCGVFVRKERWEPLTSKYHPLCHDCASNYDTDLGW